MSKVSHTSTKDKSGYDSPRDAPDGIVEDSSYATRNNEPIPVQKDSDFVEDPVLPENADSDDQLVQDETEAIDESNIIDERTRGAKPTGTYKEPNDESFEQ